MEASLYLLPLPISDSEKSSWIGSEYCDLLKGAKLFFVENVRTARRFISSLKLEIRIEDLVFEVLDKDTPVSLAKEYAKRIAVEGKSVLMSEAGCPGVADPGAHLVDAAHQMGIKIIPFVGPSSILLALMGSGLSGQNFCFHGYLPIHNADRNKKIKLLEIDSLQNQRTQIFIETPFRNSGIWESLLENLKPSTKLSFGIDILGTNQMILQKKVENWRVEPKIEWPKKPAIFLFLAS
jgi:16S rRNA (cytidine1402-2'-O)-methyltransferase